MFEHCECGTEFVYRTHIRTGKPAPIETVPDPNGNIHLLSGQRYEVLNADARATHDGPLYLNHWATCSVRGRGNRR